MFEVSRTFLLHCLRSASKGARQVDQTLQVTLNCLTKSLDDQGLSVDFADFDKVFAECGEAFGNRVLNELIAHPTIENLAREVFDLAFKTLPELCWVEIEEVGLGKVRYTPLEEEA